MEKSTKLQESHDGFDGLMLWQWQLFGTVGFVVSIASDPRSTLRFGSDVVIVPLSWLSKLLGLGWRRPLARVEGVDVVVVSRFVKWLWAPEPFSPECWAWKTGVRFRVVGGGTNSIFLASDETVQHILGEAERCGLVVNRIPRRLNRFGIGRR